MAHNRNIPMHSNKISAAALPRDLVSIITPAYQAHNIIHRAVRSVIAQTYPHWEMLIVGDDGGNYRETLTKHQIDDPRLRFFHSSQVHSGPNVTRNLALAHAKGRFIAPLDADDVYYPTRLEKLVPLARAYGMSGDNTLVVDDQTNQTYGTVFPDNGDGLWLNIQDYAQTNTPLIFVFSTNIINHYWEENIHFGADTIFNLRALEVCGRVPLCRQVLHEYRIKNGSICHSRNSFERAENAYTYCLQQIEIDGLGFQQKNAPIIKNMLNRKREQNRIMEQRLKSGGCKSYTEFFTKYNSDIKSLHHYNFNQDQTSCNPH